MAILGEEQFVERLQFFDGQRLLASDLDALDRSHRELRWLHNQSLHQPGVGRGFAVSGKKGDKSVAVQEGYAIDRDGREIVLTRPHVLQVPPVAGDGADPAVFDLVVAYPGDEDLDVTETRNGVCASAGAVRRREEPVFCWVEVQKDGQPKDADLKQRVGDATLIRLSRVKVLQCKLFADISIAERRNARPPQQPYIACGVESPVTWQFAAQTVTPEEGPVTFLNALLRAEVSTKSAEFRTTPNYFVEIRGKKPLVTGRGTFMIDGVPSVKESGLASFVIEVDVLVQRLGALVRETDALRLNSEVFEDWQVTWMGVEG